MNNNERAELNELLQKLEVLLNRPAFLHIDGKTIINGKCYGTQPPETLPNPVEGQIYFHIQ